MSKLDHRKSFLDFQYRRRAMMRKAGGMVVAIALSSCIGAGVAYADDNVTDDAVQQNEIILTEQIDTVTTVLEDNAAADGVSMAQANSGQAAENSSADDTGDAVQDAAAIPVNETAQSSDASSESDSSAKTSVAAQTSTSAASDGTLADDSKVVDASGNNIDAFDLRNTVMDTDGTLTSNYTYNEGDTQSTIASGTSYVTPVKSQSPWGSCWAFSSIAAVETSLLSELDQTDDGLMNGSISYAIAAQWLKDDMADDGLVNASIDYGSANSRLALLAEKASDLSERHLAYFAFYDVTEDSIYPDQAGEGKYLINGSNDGGEIIDVGGMPWLSMLEYSSGVGPVPEYLAPYIDDEELYQCAKLEFDETGKSLAYEYFSTYEAALDFYNKTWTEENVKAFNEANNKHLDASQWTPEKAATGTWGLDSSSAYGVIAELSNSNVLDQDLSTSGLTALEVTLMKKELLEGHPVAIAFLADQSRPGQVLAGNTYMNTDNWAQYTYENDGFNHGVTIVGYDDNYAASNFTHDIYKTDDKGKVVYDEAGNPVVDEEKTALTTPAGNGAWIVKNSWGCSTAEDPAEQSNWGIDGTGYFYLSYYDKTIGFMESFEYDVSDEAAQRLGYVAYQHNLANVEAYSTLTYSSLTSMCNVFDGPEQGEGSVSIRDLGFVTGAANDTVVLELYVMDDSADVAEMVKAGNPVVKLTATYDTSGFHRLHLDSPVKVSPNQKFAIVQTTTQSNGSFEYTFMRGYTQELVEAYNDLASVLDLDPLKAYAKTVVNKGESLLFADGSCLDLIDVAQAYNAKQAENEMNEYVKEAEKYEEQAASTSDEDERDKLLRKAAACRAFSISGLYAIDNWCIKAYADDIAIDISKALVQVIDDVYDGSMHKSRLTVTMGGTVLTEGVDYILSGNFEETEVGVYNIVIKGIGDYVNELSAVWRISPANVPDDPGDPDVPDDPDDPDVPDVPEYENDSEESEASVSEEAPVFLASYTQESAASPKTGDDSTAAVGFFGALAALSSVVMFRLRRRKNS